MDAMRLSNNMNERRTVMKKCLNNPGKKKDVVCFKKNIEKSEQDKLN
jgi:hypothetical protein